MKTTIAECRQKTATNVVRAIFSERGPKRTGCLLFVLLLVGALAGCGGSSSTVQQQPPPPPQAQFFLGALPEAPLMTPGSSFATTISALPLLGSSFNGVVAITMSPLPTGLTASPSSFSVNTANQNLGVQVTFTASSSLPTGVYPFTVTGTSGSMTYSITMAVGVVEPPPQPTSQQSQVIKASIRVQLIRRFWLRRRMECHQSTSARCRNTDRLSRFPGTA